MQVGQFVFQLDMQMRVAADIARAARTRADIVQRLFHRADHFRVLAHREVIVRAPHRDWLGPIVPMETARVGKRAFVAHDIDEDAVAAFFVQAINRFVEDLVVIHFAYFRCVAPCFRLRLEARCSGDETIFLLRSLRMTRSSEGFDP